MRWDGKKGCRSNSLRTRRRLKTYTVRNYGRDNKETYRNGNNTKTVLLHLEEGLCSAGLRRWGLLKLPFERRQFILRYLRSGRLCFGSGTRANIRKELNPSFYLICNHFLQNILIQRPGSVSCGKRRHVG